MKISHCAKTDVGVVRTENQDTYGVDALNSFFVVCDGMGGGVAGGLASQAAVEVMLKTFDAIDEKQIKTIVCDNTNATDISNLRPVASVMLANRMLNNLTLKYPKLKGMGTTAVAAKFEAATGLMHVYHSGDSRLYRVRAGIIELLTKDHSKVNELIDAGKMREEEVKSAEIQSMITRALGTVATIEVDYVAYPVQVGDQYIMCSDGLNGELEDSVIRDIVEKNNGDVSAVATALIKEANSAGGKDNTTVIALKIEDDGQTVVLPDKYVNNVLTFKDTNPAQYLFEDRALSKFSKKFNIQIPREVKEMRIFTNPIIAASFIVAAVIACILISSNYKKSTQKDFAELAGKISGIELNLREVKKERLELIEDTQDKISRLELLSETVKFYEGYTSIFPNVQILIEEQDGPNKFVGISGNDTIKIKLPDGLYKMTLSYPGYKILDENYHLIDSLNLSIELAGGLKQEVILLLPESFERSSYEQE
jgi:protein phosphatase